MLFRVTRGGGELRGVADTLTHPPSLPRRPERWVAARPDHGRGTSEGASRGMPPALALPSARPTREPQPDLPTTQPSRRARRDGRGDRDLPEITTPGGRGCDNSTAAPNGGASAKEACRRGEAGAPWCRRTGFCCLDRFRHSIGDAIPIVSPTTAAPSEVLKTNRVRPIDRRQLFRSRT
jgi:hypothetical protein